MEFDKLTEAYLRVTENVETAFTSYKNNPQDDASIQQLADQMASLSREELITFIRKIKTEISIAEISQLINSLQGRNNQLDTNVRAAGRWKKSYPR